MSDDRFYLLLQVGILVFAALVVALFVFILPAVVGP